MRCNWLIPAAMALTTVAPFAATPKISVGGEHMLLLKSDGTVWAWGRNQYAQAGTGKSTSGVPTKLEGLSGVVDIAANGSNSLALKADGTVWAWGSRSWGITGPDGSNASTPTQVTGLAQQVFLASAHGGTGFSIDTAGKVWAWGRDSYAELGSGKTNSGNYPEPRLVPSLSNVVKVVTADNHALALKADGSMVAWGEDAKDTALAGLAYGYIPPTAVNKVASAADVEISPVNSIGVSYALNADGSVQGWGDSSSGLLVCGQTTSTTQPYTITGLPKIAQIAGGSGFTLFLSASGQALACGQNSDGQLGDGTKVDIGNSTGKKGPVAVTGLPSTAGSLIQLSAGSGAAAALDRAGNVYTWGKRLSGISGEGSADLTGSNLSAIQIGINAGALADAPPTYAGTQNGTLSSATVDVGVSVAPADVGKTGQIYVGVVFPNGLLYLFGANGALSAFDPSLPIPSVYSGALPARFPLNLAQKANLFGLTGLALVVGYGRGVGVASDNDMLTSQHYAIPLVLN